MSNLTQLTERLDKIYSETAPPKPDERAVKVDRFTTSKESVAAKTRAIRELIQKRDALDGPSVASVEASAAIRREIREAEQEVEKLEMAQRKAATPKEEQGAEKPETKAKREKLELRKEIIAGLRADLKYCGELEKRRFGVALEPAPVAPPPAAIPVSGDQCISALAETDKKIDEELDSAAEKLKVLHGIAVNMNEEAGVQEKKLDSLEIAVNDENQALITVNQRLRNMLNKAAPGDKFCIWLVLFIVFLGIAGAVYGYFFAK